MYFTIKVVMNERRRRTDAALQMRISSSIASFLSLSLFYTLLLLQEVERWQPVMR